MKSILFVDDEQHILSAFTRQFQKKLPVETALGPDAGLLALTTLGEFGVVVSDARMPGMDGAEFLRQARKCAPNAVLIMLAAESDLAQAISAMGEGLIFRFLVKPCSPESLEAALLDALRHHDLLVSEGELLEKTLHGAVHVLTEMLGFAAPEAFGRAEKLRDNIRRLACTMRAKSPWELEMAAMFSQLGCVTVPPELLRRARRGAKMSDSERAMIARIPSVGGRLLKNIPRLEGVAAIVARQTDDFCQSGIPQDDETGDPIPLGARMLRVLCDLDARESAGVTAAAALDEMRACEGAYDPAVLDAVEKCFNVRRASAKAGSSRVEKAARDVRLGDRLSNDVRTRDGVLIISSGSRVTAPLLERLRNFLSLGSITEPVLVEA
jgi:response regulator RpfG family c-di-GMP phosphodiesterase